MREIRTLRLTWRGLETWPRWNCAPMPPSKERNWKPSTYSRRACPRPYRWGRHAIPSGSTVPILPFVRYVGLLQLAHARGLLSLKARFISVTPELALAEAEATFADGRVFVEAADSTTANCGPQVRAHFPRMALVRAKARCLRDALNVSECSLEEVEA